MPAIRNGNYVVSWSPFGAMRCVSVSTTSTGEVVVGIDFKHVFQT